MKCRQSVTDERFTRKNFFGVMGEGDGSSRSERLEGILVPGEDAVTLSTRMNRNRIIALAPDREFVWVQRSWENPDLGPATTIQILDEADAPERVTFGDIK